jgi:hypothetical protein
MMDAGCWIQDWGFRMENITSGMLDAESEKIIIVIFPSSEEGSIGKNMRSGFF